MHKQLHHPPTAAPIIVDGRMVAPGTFYNAPAKSFVTTDNPSAEQEVVDLGLDSKQMEPEPPGTKSVDDPPPPPVPVLLPVTENTVPSHEDLTVPAYDNITVEKMKSHLDEWEVDYSGHTTNKKTLYDFYVEEAKNRGYTVAE